MRNESQCMTIVMRTFVSFGLYPMTDSPLIPYSVEEEEIKRLLLEFRQKQIKKAEEAAAIKEHKLGVLFDESGRPL